MQTTKTIETGYLQKIEELANLLRERDERKAVINGKIRILKTKLKGEAEKNRKTILLFTPPHETVALLGKQLKVHFFNEKREYPEGGLLLKEIEIVYIEDVGKFPLEYHNDVLVRYFFDKECSNIAISLSRLKFNDKKRMIIEQVDGVGFGLSFTNEERYLEVKDFLELVKQKIDTK